MRSLWPQLAAWLDAGEPFALATVTAVSGSAPRIPGSCMAIMPESSRFIGSVSSGCLDVEVVEAARAALRTGTTQHLRFGPDPAPAGPWTEGLTCGGWVAVRVEPWWGNHARPEVRTLAPAVRGWLERDEAGIVISSKAHHLAIDAEGRMHGDTGAFSQDVLERASGHLRAERPSCLMSVGPDLASVPLRDEEAVRTPDRASRTVEGERDQAGNDASPGLFLRTIRRQPRLLIIGGVDVTVHLVVLARASGFATTVIDPRGAFVTPERFPSKPDELVRAWPQERIARAAPGPRDAALVLTHDPKIDDVALLALLRTRAGYIGALGSTRSHARRLERLRGDGADDASLARIRGPAGLHLGTPDAAGIALGIMAGVAAWQAEEERARLAHVSSEMGGYTSVLH